MTPGAYVYIMASGRNGTIYVGATTEIARRAWKHRTGVVEGFTKRHGCHVLVWYEPHGRYGRRGCASGG